MRKLRLLLLVLALGSLVASGAANAQEECEPTPGPVVADNETPCFPTPEQCATGNYNGIYDTGLVEEMRAGICVGAAGHIIVYVAGKASTICGSIFVADTWVTGNNDPYDPNTCP
jgi:hypothetical protein